MDTGDEQQEIINAFSAATDVSGGMIVTLAMDALDHLKNGRYGDASSLYKVIAQSASALEHNAQLLFVTQALKQFDK